MTHDDAALISGTVTDYPSDQDIASDALLSGSWQLKRRWRQYRENQQAEHKTRDLSQFKCVAMLGAAGSGKTTEAKCLQDFERELGKDVQWCRLAEFSGSKDELSKKLAQLSDQATQNTIIYLDALDEAMVPLRSAWLAIKQWLDCSLRDSGASVRITCRSTVWPSELAAKLKEYADNVGYCQANLQPLNDSDIRSAAQHTSNVDPSRFVDEISRRRAGVLVEHPLTLRMLLKLFATSECLPSRLSELFHEGLRTLAADSNDRFDIGSAVSMSPDEILAAAELLACYVVLSGRETIDLGDEPGDNTLHWSNLPSASNGEARLDREHLRSIGSCGIFEAESPASFRFGHRQFAEYLAGRRLARLLPHQARSLLAHPFGPSYGVAGPLCETAAFAAMSNQHVAEWLAEHDPEVVGMSDVADDNLRKAAAHELFARLRDGRLTVAQICNDIDLQGFQYAGAEKDLRPLLNERDDESYAVLICAIRMIESWRLESMCNDLARLALDPKAQLNARTSAGYALRSMGTVHAREMLKPLAFGVPEDKQLELRALAVHCNWPDRLSTPELLKALVPRERGGFYGSYETLLLRLDQEQFCSAGYAVDGLRWARDHLVKSGNDSDPAHRIAMRIVHSALQEMDDPEVLRELVDLLWYCESTHLESPLGPLRGSKSAMGQGKPELPAPLFSDASIRRQLISAVVQCDRNSQDIWMLAPHTPGMCVLEDFPWLLERGCDESLSMLTRTSYLEIARFTGWDTRSEYVDAWLAVRDQEPVKSVLGCHDAIPLESEEAAKLRAEWKAWHENRKPSEPEVLNPPPRKRVLESIHLAETKDIEFFHHICQDMTLTETSTNFGFERFLVRSPGWAEADDNTKSRIVDVAKRFLDADELDEPETCRERPLNDILGGCMDAFWLILDRDLEWLRTCDRDYWRRWCWYILRGLWLNMHDVPEEPKRALFSMLHHEVPDTVRDEIIQIATQNEEETNSLLANMLEFMDCSSGAELDAALCERLNNNEVSLGCIELVAQYLLARIPNDAIPVCLSMLKGPDSVDNNSASVSAAVSLLYVCPSRAWPEVEKYIQNNHEHGRCVLRKYAHGTRYRVGQLGTQKLYEQLTAEQLGELADLCLQLFPVETDPDYGGAHHVSSDDSARVFRDRIVEWLTNQIDAASVESLRKLEQKYHGRYPRLHYARVRAERQFIASQWNPVPVTAVAQILSSNEKRLVRSEEDVLNGINAALERYEYRLLIDSADHVEDLWNCEQGSSPCPKHETHVSNKLCGVIRDYFDQYGICADREVEIHRRKVPKVHGGTPASELDILVQAPAVGSAIGKKIRVPIEVKLSCNREAKTGMKQQLVERYMPQLDATHGMYVLVWMNVPEPTNLHKSHRPMWPTLEDARKELAAQAEEYSNQRGVRVYAFVLDAALM